MRGRALPPHTLRPAVLVQRPSSWSALRLVLVSSRCLLSSQLLGRSWGVCWSRLSLSSQISVYKSCCTVQTKLVLGLSKRYWALHLEALGGCWPSLASSAPLEPPIVLM